MADVATIELDRVMVTAVATIGLWWLFWYTIVWKLTITRYP